MRELNGTVTAECDNSNGYVGDTMEFLEERIAEYHVSIYSNEYEVTTGIDL